MLLNMHQGKIFTPVMLLAETHALMKMSSIWEPMIGSQSTSFNAALLSDRKMMISKGLIENGGTRKDWETTGNLMRQEWNNVLEWKQSPHPN